MKKFLLSIFMMTLLVCTGCGNATQKVDYTTVELSELAPDSNKLIPNCNVDMTVNNPGDFGVTFSNVTDDDYDSYIKECKKTFSKVEYETSIDGRNGYQGTTDDGVCQIMIIFDSSFGKMTVYVTR